MIVSQSLGELCIMKSTGSDATKIFSTMKAFGPEYRYVIMGYPPFLKSLIDNDDFDLTSVTLRGDARRVRLAVSPAAGRYGTADVRPPAGASTAGS
jgi:hypothetical protein